MSAMAAIPPTHVVLCPVLLRHRPALSPALDACRLRSRLPDAPRGGWVFGRIADRRGRRFSPTLAISLAALGSPILAVSPTISEIGVLDSVVLLLARLVQGLSHGGETGSAFTFLAEVAPAEDHPDVTITVTTADQHRLVQQLRSGEIELAIAYKMHLDRVLLRERFVAVAQEHAPGLRPEDLYSVGR